MLNEVQYKYNREQPNTTNLEPKSNEKGIIVGGFYREWTHNGIKSNEEQLKNMEILTSQIDQVSQISPEVIN